MKNAIIILVVFFAFQLYGQKTEFGMSFDAGFPIISTQKEMIKTENSLKSPPAADQLIRPHSLWNVLNFQFETYPIFIPNLSFSIGVRMFNYGWEVDTISTTYYIGSSTSGYWKEVFARSEAKNGYLLPTLSVGYTINLSSTLRARPFLSFGLFQTFSRVKRNSFAFDPADQDIFDYNDGGFKEGAYFWDIDANVNDFQIGGRIEYFTKRFALFTTVSYYHFSRSIPIIQGKITFDALHLNAGISYRFHRKAD